MISMQSCGGSGIRTHDTVSRIHAFQACALSHSAIPPKLLRSRQYSPARSGDKPALRPRSCASAQMKTSIDPPHVARLAHVVTGEFAGAFAERRRADELEQRLQARQGIVALAPREIEVLPCERHKI